MSGAHSAFRTPNRPLFDDQGRAVLAHDRRGRLKLRRLTDVIGRDKHGNPHYGSHLVPAQRHVLDYRPHLDRPSKHRAGRMKPMTAEERRVRARFNRLHVQASKSRAEDAKAMRKFSNA